MYAAVGRPSIPPERLLRAQLRQIFDSIRSERLLMEQLDYNLPFGWFVGLEVDEPIIGNRSVRSRSQPRSPRRNKAAQLLSPVPQDNELSGTTIARGNLRPGIVTVFAFDFVPRYSSQTSATAATEAHASARK